MMKDGFKALLDGLTVENIIKLGVPAVVALWLVQWMTSSVDSKLDRLVYAHTNTTLVSLEQHQAETTQHRALLEMVGRTYTTNEQILWVMRQACANEADDNAERKRCLSNPNLAAAEPLEFPAPVVPVKPNTVPPEVQQAVKPPAEN